MIKEHRMNRFFTLLLAASCLTAVGQYEVGDVGPAGGWIFYADTLDLFDFDFMEVASNTEDMTPNWGGHALVGQNTAPSQNLGRGAYYSSLYLGQASPWQIATLSTGGPAALIHANGCTQGGYGDWFLPTIEDCEVMRQAYGDSLIEMISFDSDDPLNYSVWTASCFLDGTNYTRARTYDLSNGHIGSQSSTGNQWGSSDGRQVLPIRTFSLLNEQLCGVGTIWNPSSQTCIVDESACGWQPDGNGDNLIGVNDLLDLLGVYGDTDYDQDDIWDSVDDCVGQYDECGVCNGSGPSIPIIESIEILYDSVYAGPIDEWLVFEVGADTLFEYVCDLPEYEHCPNGDCTECVASIQVESQTTCESFNATLEPIDGVSFEWTLLNDDSRFWTENDQLESYDSPGELRYIDFCFDSEGYEYLVLNRDQSESESGYSGGTDSSFVITNRSGQWSILGEDAFVSHKTLEHDIEIYQDQVYVAFQDSEAEGHISVMTYVNEQWQYVGSPGINDLGLGSNGGVSQSPDLVIADGVPYVVFRDWKSGQWSDLQEEGQLSLMKFEEGSWQYVVDEGQTELSRGLELNFAPGYQSWVDMPQLIFDDGKPTVSYLYLSSVWVIQFDQGSWQVIYQETESASSASDLFEHDGAVFFSYRSNPPYITRTFKIVQGVVQSLPSLFLGESGYHQFFTLNDDLHFSLTTNDREEIRLYRLDEGTWSLLSEGGKLEADAPSNVHFAANSSNIELVYLDDVTKEIRRRAFEFFSTQGENVELPESGQYIITATDSVGCVVTEELEFEALLCGCTDESAVNFDALAVIDDGSCEYP